MSLTLNRKADSNGNFVVDGGYGFSFEPLYPSLGAAPLPFALNVVRDESGESPLIITSSRAHFQPKPFRKLVVSGAVPGSQWLVTVYEQGESVGAAVAPARGQWDLLYSNTALPVAAAGNWWGPSGKFVGFGAADIFDLRPYRYIHSTFSAATLSGTSPTLKLVFGVCDNLEPTLVTAVEIQEIKSTNPIGAGGNQQQAYIGETSGFALSGGSYGRDILFSPARILFCRLGIEVGGTLSSIENGRLFLWGVRA